VTRGRISSPRRIDLRAVTEEDLPIFFEHQREPEANHMASFPARDRQAFMAHWTRILADGAVSTKTVLVDGQVAGNVVSWDQAGRRLVGYWIGREFWGRGVATRALSAFVAEVAERPLHARVARNHVASIRVLEKCGFTIWDEEDPSFDDPDDDVEEVLLRLDGHAGEDTGGFVTR
jgi:RimJ/RimL family protein N-acetyltransferase